MKFKQLFDNWNLTGLKIKTSFLEMDWAPGDADKDAAWELYIELLTRVSTQALHEKDGSEKAALDSIYSLFPTTRNVLKNHGRGCLEFSKIAIIILNQVIRPFTSKWHPIIDRGHLTDNQKLEFRSELKKLQATLTNYTHLVAHIADIEENQDITDLEN